MAERLLFAVPLLVLLALPAQGQSAQLKELKRTRDRARDAHHDSIVKISLLEQDMRRYERELSRVTARVRELQGQPEGLIRDQQLQAMRRDQNHVSRQLATLKVRLRAEQDARQVRRLSLIQASWRWVARLLETADRAWRINRHKQAKEHTDLALAELKRLEDLEALEDSPREDYQPDPVDPEASLQELTELKQLFEALVDGFVEQTTELAPVESRLRSRVAHLDRLVQYSYAVPTLGQRLERARDDLERVAGMRRKAESRATAYRRRIEAIDAVLSERRLRERKAEERNGR